MSIKEKMLRIYPKAFKRNRKKIEISYEEALELREEHPSMIVLDVRSMQEYQEYHLEGAINIPLYELKQKASKRLDKNTMILVYCQSGGRSKRACKILNRYGVSEYL